MPTETPPRPATDDVTDGRTLTETLLGQLNPEQRTAATHGDGPLLVIAGAGTGKTTTLVHRVAALVARGVPPERILLLTFTRRAAEEMLRRTDTVLRRATAAARHTGAFGQLAAGSVWGGTFHAIASRLLRVYGESLGLPPGFTILDRPDAEDLIHAARTTLELDTSRRRFPRKGTCLDIYSRCVNAGEPLGQVLKTRYPWCVEHEEDLKRLFSAYVDHKEHHHVLDYDDLLLFWRAMLADPLLGPRVRGRFDAVLVDEYQDTNAVQADIIALLAPDGCGLTAVGDDAQAIYGFRGTTVRNILDFPARFPGTEVVTLERNYRSTGPLLEASNAVIALASERFAKDLRPAREGGERPTLVTCRDEHEQAAYVADRILGHREDGVLLQDQAVLFRAAHHSTALEVELRHREIPYVKYGGLKFLEAAHVKDLLAFLRLAENPLDGIAGLRVLELLPGIGPRTAAALVASLAESGGDFSAWRACDVPDAAAPLWTRLGSLLETLASMPSAEVTAQIGAVRDFYAPLCAERYDDGAARLADLEQIEHLGARFPDRTTLLADFVLDAPSWSGDFAGPPLLDEDYLILSTMHSAKGLEFDVVYVIHAADGNIPSDMATGTPEEVDEERRLFYVACTRARDALYVTHPLRYYAAGRGLTDAYGYAQRTRFIPDDLRPLFREIQAVPAVAADEPAVPITTTADVRASIRAMWE